MELDINVDKISALGALSAVGMGAASSRLEVIWSVIWPRTGSGSLRFGMVPNVGDVARTKKNVARFRFGTGTVYTYRYYDCEFTPVGDTYVIKLSYFIKKMLDNK